MKFHLVTIFPEFFRGPLDYGVVARGAQSGLLEIQLHNLRDWTSDFHKTVDDRPFGGGEGMVLKPQPLFEAVETILPERDRRRHRVALLSAHGPVFDQSAARRLLQYEEVVLICGRYEGVDERVAEHLADEEISIGNFVLSGGELGAAVVVDAVARLIPGVLGNEDSSLHESFSGVDESEENLLDCPHYTRPADFRGFRVPDVLLSGNHAVIREWRRKAAVEKMARVRPELMARFREVEPTRPAAGGKSLERNGQRSHDEPLSAEDPQ
jgi:tRNA (guanine37-N1)-methyltransferase